VRIVVVVSPGCVELWKAKKRKVDWGIHRACVVEFIQKIRQMEQKMTLSVRAFNFFLVRGKNCNESSEMPGIILCNRRQQAQHDLRACRRQHTSAYVSIRQQATAYVRIRVLCQRTINPYDLLQPFFFIFCLPNLQLSVWTFFR